MEEERRIETRDNECMKVRRVGWLLLRMMFCVRGNTNLMGFNSLI